MAFDLARSLLVSSYLTPFDRPLEGATVDSARSLAIARLFEHRPETHMPDSRWSMVAGAGDDALPEMSGGVRFYTVDWADVAELTVASLSLPARSATSSNANVLVDLAAGDERDVIVSLTYAAAEAGVVQEWDGENDQVLTSLPATLDDDGTLRWMRQSLLLDPAIRFDYQGGGGRHQRPAAGQQRDRPPPDRGDALLGLGAQWPGSPPRRVLGGVWASLDRVIACRPFNARARPGYRFKDHRCCDQRPRSADRKCPRDPQPAGQ
ncbi:MAG TPA: hypothetical protein ENK31_07925 [Nannocystis exedens]|nr:hypothetical protein [Nannocystis exedens]